MKVLTIQMPDGWVWGVPANIVADAYAKYFNENYEEDFAHVMGSDYEIKDWASNNMNWADVKAQAFKVRTWMKETERDFQEGWVNGEKKVEELNR